MSFAGLGFFFALGVKGLGGVLSIRLRTSSSLGAFAISEPSIEDFPDELMPALYTVLGQLVLAWGNIEASLNLTISVIYHSADGKSIDPDMPRTQLKRRLDFMRDCANKLPLLAPVQSRIVDLMGRIGGHAAIRNSVLHGFFSNYDTKTGDLTFTSLRGKDDFHEVREITGTLAHLQDAAAAALAVGSEVAVLMHALSEALMGAQDVIHQSSSESPV